MVELAFGGSSFPSLKQLEHGHHANFTINRDVMTKLPDEARMIINSNAEVVNKLGSNAMSNFLYVYKGVYATDEDVPVDPATGLLRVRR